ncbi:MAG: DUF1848 family protein [Planctomycetes bacterium]|nr:DUF1848 family protein [Planctomycetota bacterium]
MDGKWSAERLEPSARSVSASRRTDIPALFPRWFGRRLDEGFAEYVPLGPPRRIRCSLRPEDVTHFTFWSKWPRPFFSVLERILAAGYPVLWNVTVTGLGGTLVEPHAPRLERAVAALLALARLVPPAAIQWRYDPVFLSARYDRRHHLETFRRLVGALAGHVDRAAISFVHRYPRQVVPDLKAYERETGDAVADPPLAERVDLAGELCDIAAAAGVPLTLCCSKEVREALGAAQSECNSFAWARRVYPALAAIPPLKNRPCRGDCGCSAEVDIGAYETCILGCRYSYGSCNERGARKNFARHDPESPCLFERAPTSG